MYTPFVVNKGVEILDRKAKSDTPCGFLLSRAFRVAKQPRRMPAKFMKETLRRL